MTSQYTKRKGARRPGRPSIGPTVQVALKVQKPMMKKIDSVVMELNKEGIVTNVSHLIRCLVENSLPMASEIMRHAALEKSNG